MQLKSLLISLFASLSIAQQAPPNNNYIGSTAASRSVVTLAQSELIIAAAVAEARNLSTRRYLPGSSQSSSSSSSPHSRSLSQLTDSLSRVHSNPRSFWPPRRLRAHGQRLPCHDRPRHQEGAHRRALQWCFPVQCSVQCVSAWCTGVWG